MSRATALVLVNVVMVLLVTAASVALGQLGAGSEVVMLVIFGIGSCAALAVSEVVAHYAKREESQGPRRSHNAPPSG